MSVHSNNDATLPRKSSPFKGSICQKCKRLPLIEWNVVIRHGEDHGINRGAVDLSNGMALVEFTVPIRHFALRRHCFEQGVLELRVPIPPRFAPNHVLRGSGVKISVGE